MQVSCTCPRLESCWFLNIKMWFECTFMMGKTVCIYIYIYTLPLRDGILHVEESYDSCCVMCRMHYLHSNFGSFPEDASKRKELRSPCLQLMAFKRRLAILISMECMCACMQVQQISFEQIWTRGRHVSTAMSVLISCTFLVHQDSC